MNGQSTIMPSENHIEPQMWETKKKKKKNKWDHCLFKEEPWSKEKDVHFATIPGA